MSRKRPFAPYEIQILKECAGPYKELLEDQRKDKITLQLKAEAWDDITESFHSLSDSVYRDQRQLYKCWGNIKARENNVSKKQSINSEGASNSELEKSIDDSDDANFDSRLPDSDKNLKTVVEKKKRKVSANSDELSVLLKYTEQHKELLSDRRKDPATLKRKNELWVQIAESFNGESDVRQRKPGQLRRLYFASKQKVNRKLETSSLRNEPNRRLPSNLTTSHRHLSLGHNSKLVGGRRPELQELKMDHERQLHAVRLSNLRKQSAILTYLHNKIKTDSDFATSVMVGIFSKNFQVVSSPDESSNATINSVLHETQMDSVAECEPIRVTYVSESGEKVTINNITELCEEP